jgi:hypothetical protein
MMNGGGNDAATFELEIGKNDRHNEHRKAISPRIKKARLGTSKKSHAQ